MYRDVAAGPTSSVLGRILAAGRDLEAAGQREAAGGASLQLSPHTGASVQLSSPAARAADAGNVSLSSPRTPSVPAANAAFSIEAVAPTASLQQTSAQTVLFPAW